MVSTRKKKNQQRRQFSQLNENVNDFVIADSNNISAIGNETLEPQASGRYNNAERIINGESNSCQNQVTENNIDSKVRQVVDNAVMIVENCMHDAILTAMDNVVMPRVEMAVRSIIGSSGQGSSRVVQNPDRRDSTGNTENTPRMSASSRSDVNVDQDKDEETRNVENFEEGDFPALRPNYDRSALARHRKTSLDYKKTILFLNLQLNLSLNHIKFSSVSFLEITSFNLYFYGFIFGLIFIKSNN